MNFTPTYEKLKLHIKSLDEKFLTPFIPTDPTHMPSDYQLDVSAFCILTHAAIEEYFEEISSVCTHSSIDNWVNYRKINLILLSISINFCNSIPNYDEKKPYEPVEKNIRESIERARTEIKGLLNENHGISKKYVHKILKMIGINCQSDVIFEQAISKIVEHRGEFAHRRGTKHIPPEDARRLSEDCLLYCLDIATKAADAVKYY